ncbi:MAG TPA: MAPEG family protein [Terriglobales bacterium]|nr:MAPEG family protein [Terriglobales bacterium]
MELVALVTLIALIEYFIFGMLVGQARGTYDVPAPAMTGHPVFERYVRAHLNTLEHLIIFLPAMWLFAHYVSAGWAALLGLVFIAGRFLYFRGYIVEASQRAAGFATSMIAQGLLVIGAFFGVLADLF